MNIKYIFILLIVFLSHCKSITVNDDKSCEEMNQEILNYIYKFQMNNDSLYLDTALTYTELALTKCNELKVLLIHRKIDILGKKKDYLKAASYIKTIDFPLFSQLPYYNDFIEYRFTAMNYQNKYEYHKRDSCLHLILYDLNEFVSKNKQELDSIIQLNDVIKIYNNTIVISLMQYYYTKSVLFGYENTKKELDIYQEELNGNKDFFDNLNEQISNVNFLDFAGY